jgi:hypothetical protein
MSACLRCLSDLKLWRCLCSAAKRSAAATQDDDDDDVLEQLLNDLDESAAPSRSKHVASRCVGLPCRTHKPPLHHVQSFTKPVHSAASFKSALFTNLPSAVESRGRLHQHILHTPSSLLPSLPPHLPSQRTTMPTIVTTLMSRAQALYVMGAQNSNIARKPAFNLTQPRQTSLR